MDESKYSVSLVSLVASTEEAAYLTNAGYPITYDGNLYSPEDGLKIKLPNLGASMSTQEGTIGTMKIAGVLLTNLSNKYPYSKVTVSVKELDIDPDTEVVDAERTLFEGLVYQVSPMPLKGYISLIIRERKYYADITAGIPCTEQCTWKYLGGRGCQAVVLSEEHTVSSITGTYLTVTEDLSNTTEFLFNKGYVELDGARITIKYHKSGKTFQLAKTPPDLWAGSTVTIYSGCDRQIATCRNIYDNESHFLGLGVSMVDYSPFYELQ